MDLSKNVVNNLQCEKLTAGMTLDCADVLFFHEASTSYPEDVLMFRYKQCEVHMPITCPAWNHKQAQGAVRWWKCELMDTTTQLEGTVNTGLKPCAHTRPLN